MTGRAFMRFIRHRGIPLSCFAEKLNCKLSTLRDLTRQEQVPHYYIIQFIIAFHTMLSDEEVRMLTE
ncbi:MAG: hypothetical protein AAGJ37_00110 [Pseudomonadota bacterium]